MVDDEPFQPNHKRLGKRPPLWQDSHGRSRELYFLVLVVASWSLGTEPEEGATERLAKPLILWRARKEPSKRDESNG
jgi:hypothetical protein